MKSKLIAAGAVTAEAAALVLAHHLDARAYPPDSTPRPTPIVAPPATGQLGPLPTLAPLVKQLRPSVVNIYTTQNMKPKRPHLGPRGRGGDQDDDSDEFFKHFFG